MGKLSRFPGVSWHPQLKRWVVKVSVLVGTYDNEQEAGEAARRIDRGTGEIRRFVVGVGRGDR
jgi:hypothetical protein